MIPRLAELAKRDRDWARLLYRTVAERIRSRLDPPDAAVVAGWFDRLGAGEAPQKVFATPQGRRRGTTNPRKPMSDGRIPDDADVAWLVRQAVEQCDLPQGEASIRVAEALDMNPGTVENIYIRLRGELGPSQKSQK